MANKKLLAALCSGFFAIGLGMAPAVFASSSTSCADNCDAKYNSCTAYMAKCDYLYDVCMSKCY
jgi:hypothetical protein